MKISVVIAFYNEVENINFVIDECLGVLRALGKEFEIIAVDDGSRDGTGNLLHKMAEVNTEIRVIAHPRNCGQAAGWWTGFEAATGNVIVTMDGDRQNDFHDVPRLLSFLGPFDAVFGQRVRRNDPFYKLVASKIGNSIRKFLLNDGVRDTACGLKVMKKETLKYLIPIEGFQRFIPFMLREAGVPCVAVDVNHRPRLAGKSKYSLLRLYFVPTIVDLLFMGWYKINNLFRRRRRI